MSNPTQPASKATDSAKPERLLILDTSGPSARWLIVSVTLDTDTRPARMAGSRYTDWPEVTAWCREQVGPAASLTPAAAMVWRIDER